MAPLAAKQLRIGLRSLGTKIGIGRDGYWGGGGGIEGWDHTGFGSSGYE